MVTTKFGVGSWELGVDNKMSSELGIRNWEFGIRNGLLLRTPNSPARRATPRPGRAKLRTRGQASVETVFAIWGALLLVFASFVIMRWVVDRLVTRQEAYDASRLAAAAWSYCDPSWYIEKGRAVPANCKQVLPATVEVRPKQGTNPAVVVTQEQIEQAWVWEDNDPAEQVPLKIFNE